MATYYWDPVAGNDGNDGTTFANRKKTLQSLTGVVTNDTVRCIASPDPTSLGQSATWTDGSNTVTLTSAVTANIASCDTAWTASSNVTATATTTRKEGTNAANVAIAAAFTTGKAAYFATGTLDLSSYQQVSFWVRQSAGTVNIAGDTELHLCTDTIGAVSVHTIPLPPMMVLNTWYPVTVDLGGALNSAIASISFFVNVDRAAVTFQIDNIMACKASSAADSLTLSSLIGRNTTNDSWLAVRSINSTTVMLEAGSPNSDMTLTGFPIWSGTTGAVTTWKRETLKTAVAAVSTTQINAYAGTGTGPVTISGGWNATDMSTQTGKSYLDGTNGTGYGLCFSSTAVLYSGITFSNINFLRYSRGISLEPLSNSNTITVTTDDLNNNDTCGIYSVGFSTQFIYLMTLNVTNAMFNGRASSASGVSVGGSLSNGGSNASRQTTVTAVNIASNWGAGLAAGGWGGAGLAGSSLTVVNLSRNTTSGLVASLLVGSVVNISAANYNTGSSGNGGIQLADGGVGCHDNLITLGSCASGGTGSNGIYLGNSANNNKITLTAAFTGYTATYNSGGIKMAVGAGKNYIVSTAAPFSSCVSGGCIDATSGGGGQLLLKTADTSATFNGSVGSDALVIFLNWNGVPGNTRLLSSVNTAWSRYGI